MRGSFPTVSREQVVKTLEQAKEALLARADSVAARFSEIGFQPSRDAQT